MCNQVILRNKNFIFQAVKRVNVTSESSFDFHYVELSYFVAEFTAPAYF